MKAVQLPGVNRTTSALGFGCAYLFGGFQTQTSLRLLNTAFDLGYRHFDVAPVYGFGMAEDVLGAFLRGRREHVTLASKVGLEPPRFGYLLANAYHVLAPLKHTPLGRALGRKAYETVAPRGRFDVKSVERSLHRSLISLKTDHIDLLLLHDVHIDLITDALLTVLSRFHRDGKILSLGAATSPEQIKIIRHSFGSVFDVWQHTWDVFDARKGAFPKFTITHRSLHSAFARLHDLLIEKPDMVRRLSAHLDCDIEDPACLSRILIGASVAANPDGMILVGTRQSRRLSENAQVFDTARWQKAGAALSAFLLSDEGQAFLGLASARYEAHT